ncbi:hypothetical protein, partial [Acidovorax sp.]|uniref:hypothetical protein n=1 Tax=Acidovorax sp. TaxID=1872122 RepID=UPI0025B7CCDE
KRLKKAGSKTIPEPGSVSRLAGSAHRWDELYADGVQGKTTQSQTNCSSIGNNRAAGRRMAVGLPNCLWQTRALRFFV